MDAAPPPPAMVSCLFVAALSHSVPSVCCFVCVFYSLSVSSSPSLLHHLLPLVFSLRLAPPPLHVSTSHLPMTKYLFTAFLHPSSLPLLYPFLSISSSPYLRLSSSSSLAPSIRKRTSIPTVRSGATPSAPWRDSGLLRTVVCWPPIAHTPAAPARTSPALRCSWPTWRSRYSRRVLFICCYCQKRMGKINGSAVQHLINRSWKREEGGRGDHNILRIDQNSPESSDLTWQSCFYNWFIKPDDKNVHFIQPEVLVSWSRCNAFKAAASLSTVCSDRSSDFVWHPVSPTGPEDVCYF